MFGLPFLRLRWLVAAAIAAGGWTYVNENGLSWQAPTQKQERRAGKAQDAGTSREKPSARAALPAKVAVPERRPDAAARARTSPLVTASIPKAPIPRPANLREAPRVQSDVVPPAPRPRAATAPETPLPPAAPAPAAPKRTAAVAGPQGMTPLRKPQDGDCQCPYDLMINGSACGDRSAMVRQNRPATACYR